MKFALIAVFVSLLPLAASAACDVDTLKDVVGKATGDGYFSMQFTKAKIEGSLNPGQTMNVMVAVDDFDVTNKSSDAVLVVSLFGQNTVGDDAFWLAQVNPATCAVVTAYEVLNNAGGGL
jgi:hypothetical protein